MQQHFNDIEMRIRSMFVTVLVALIASIGFLMDKKLAFSVGNFNFQFATIVPLNRRTGYLPVLFHGSLLVPPTARRFSKPWDQY